MASRNVIHRFVLFKFIDTRDVSTAVSSYRKLLADAKKVASPALLESSVLIRAGWPSLRTRLASGSRWGR
ncbi:hypothetical protein MRB53_039715 [Persea americana]|nr:hypothetical protein MRB53_039715 [Persea americana]